MSSSGRDAADTLESSAETKSAHMRIAGLKELDTTGIDWIKFIRAIPNHTNIYVTQFGNSAHNISLLLPEANSPSVTSPNMRRTSRSPLSRLLLNFASILPASALLLPLPPQQCFCSRQRTFVASAAITITDAPPTDASSVLTAASFSPTGYFVNADEAEDAFDRAKDSPQARCPISSLREAAGEEETPGHQPIDSYYALPD